MLYTVAHSGEPLEPSDVGHTVVVGIEKKMKIFSERSACKLSPMVAKGPGQ